MAAAAKEAAARAAAEEAVETEGECSEGGGG